jgi:hypothetical protein
MKVIAQTWHFFSYRITFFLTFLSLQTSNDCLTICNMDLICRALQMARYFHILGENIWPMPKDKKVRADEIFAEKIKRQLPVFGVKGPGPRPPSVF